mmetsp:Transcript_10440/g.20724  ORF Transcript_10440/g.20724 Transcript_10440/m.20724 type:complete len:246 (+) Transcript_10440:262-999(+)
MAHFYDYSTIWSSKCDVVRLRTSGLLHNFVAIHDHSFLLKCCRRFAAQPSEVSFGSRNISALGFHRLGALARHSSIGKRAWEGILRRIFSAEVRFFRLGTRGFLLGQGSHLESPAPEFPLVPRVLAVEVLLGQKVNWGLGSAIALRGSQRLSIRTPCRRCQVDRNREVRYLLLQVDEVSIVRLFHDQGHHGPYRFLRVLGEILRFFHPTESIARPFVDDYANLRVTRNDETTLTHHSIGTVPLVF